MIAIDWGTIAQIFNNVSVNMVPTAMFLNLVMILVSFMGFGVFAMFVNDILTEGQTFEEIEPCKARTDIPMAVQIANREHNWGIQKAYTLASSDVPDMACFEIDTEPEIVEQKNEYVLKSIESVEVPMAQGEFIPSALAEIKAALQFEDKFENVKANTKALIKEMNGLFSKPEFLLV